MNKPIRCTTHFHACDCREYEFQERIKLLERQNEDAISILKMVMSYKGWIIANALGTSSRNFQDIALYKRAIEFLAQIEAMETSGDTEGRKNWRI